MRGAAPDRTRKSGAPRVIRASPLLVLSFLAAVGCSSPERAERSLERNGTDSVTGTVAYRERIALPPGAIVQVLLEEVGRQDAPSQAIAEVRVAADRQVPIPFTLVYDAAAIDPNGRYALRATIRSAEGSLEWSTTEHYPVITHGAPREVDLIVQRAPPSGAPTPNKVWEEAWGRGVDFRAIGQEPGWLLEIVEGGDIVFVADYGEKKISAPAPPPLIESESRRRFYNAVTEANDLSILIEMKPCQDSMSGEEFPSTVTVTLDGRSYPGCGRAR